MGHKQSRPDPKDLLKPGDSPYHPHQIKGDEKCYLMEENPDPIFSKDKWYNLYNCIAYKPRPLVSVFGNEDAGGSTDPKKVRHEDVPTKRKRSAPAPHPYPYHPPPLKGHGEEKCYIVGINTHPKPHHERECVPYKPRPLVSVFGNEDAGASTDPKKIRYEDVNMKRKRWLPVEGEGENAGYIEHPEGPVSAFEYVGEEYSEDGDSEESADGESENPADHEDDFDENVAEVPSFDNKLVGRDVPLMYIDGVPHFGSQEKSDIAGLQVQDEPLKVQPLGTAASMTPAAMAAMATPTVLASAAQATIGSGNASQVIDYRHCPFVQAAIGVFRQTWEYFKPTSLLLVVLLFIALIMTCMWSMSRSATRARSQDVETGYYRQVGHWAVPRWLFVGKENQVVI